MRLNDIQIIERLIERNPEKRLVITPMISAGEQIGPSSVDVHLGTEFMVVAQSDRQSFDPLMSRPQYEEWRKHLRLANRYSLLDPFILHPTQFALGTTLEFISLPDDIVGRIDGRSSWARQGLVIHSTAGDIHPGSRGFVVFELMNVGPVPILLYPGLAIAQLTFVELAGPAGESYSKRASSKYSGFRQSLWSGYPDDSILREMRKLKSAEVETNYAQADMAVSGHSRSGPKGFMSVSDSVQFNNNEKPEDELEASRRYFDEHRSLLLEYYSGEYVAIRGHDVVAHDRDYSRLSKSTYDKDGNRPIYIAFVSADPERIGDLGGPKRRV